MQRIKSLHSHRPNHLPVLLVRLAAAVVQPRRALAGLLPPWLGSCGDDQRPLLLGNKRQQEAKALFNCRVLFSFARRSHPSTARSVGRSQSRQVDELTDWQSPLRQCERRPHRSSTFVHIEKTYDDSALSCNHTQKKTYERNDKNFGEEREKRKTKTKTFSSSHSALPPFPYI